MVSKTFLSSKSIFHISISIHFFSFIIFNASFMIVKLINHKKSIFNNHCASKSGQLSCVIILLLSFIFHFLSVGYCKGQKLVIGFGAIITAQA